MRAGHNAETLSPLELAALLRLDLASFIERSFYELNPGREFVIAPYIEVIATKLEAVRNGRIKRLIINLPPRYLKSHCASVVFPAWILGHEPGKKLLCVSYGQDLTENTPRLACVSCEAAFIVRYLGMSWWGATP